MIMGAVETVCEEFEILDIAAEGFLNTLYPFFEERNLADKAKRRDFFWPSPTRPQFVK